MRAALAVAVTLVGALVGTATVQVLAATPPDIGDAMLADLGDGWQLTSESEANGSLTRTFSWTEWQPLDQRVCRHHASRGAGDVRSDGAIER